MDDFTARDLFAGLAMCGLIASPKDAGTGEKKVKSLADFAEVAYIMADAMLKEKEKRDGVTES